MVHEGIKNQHCKICDTAENYRPRSENEIHAEYITLHRSVLIYESADRICSKTLPEFFKDV